MIKLDRNTLCRSKFNSLHAFTRLVSSNLAAESCIWHTSRCSSPLATTGEQNVASDEDFDGYLQIRIEK